MIDALRQLIQEDKKYFFSEPSKGTIELKEEDNDMSIDIVDVPPQALAFNCTYKKATIHIPIIRVGSKYSFCKKCDYILFAPTATKNRWHAVLCEMKNTTILNEDDVCHQIQCTRPFIAYIKKMLEVHFEQSIKFEEHYVLIFENTNHFNKSFVHAKPASYSYKYKGMVHKVFSSESIPYHRLLNNNPSS